MNDEQSTPEKPLIALVTAPADVSQSLARALVERRLAACVNLIPAVHSIYRWQGAIEEADEALLIIKATASAVEALNSTLRELHPYDVYELVTLPITGGNPAYLTWLIESVEK